jgi:transposase
VPPSVTGVNRAPISMSCELACGRSREGGRTKDVAYYNSDMAMGKRKSDWQPAMWVTMTNLPTAASHPFYRRLNQLLREQGFDDFVEAQCAGFYAETMGRPGLPPGIYFRLLLIGYFEGIDAERGIVWRAADSLALRDFLGIGLDQAPPDHSTISRTRRLIALETHRAVFTWILQCLSTAGLVKGKTIGIDATTLEANAALRSIVRRDTGESYEEFLTKLAKASGIGTPTRADWRGSIGSGRRRARMTTGPIRTIRTPRSRE